MGYCTRSEYPHRLLILRLTAYFISLRGVFYGSHRSQVLLLRALNLTEVGGY